jgi:hypothetical protein
VDFDVTASSVIDVDREIPNLTREILINQRVDANIRKATFGESLERTFAFETCLFF